MKINPYLNFNGTCREAMTFYAQVLGGQVETMMTHGESPMAGQVPADWQGAIIHALVRVGDMALMASDAPAGYYAKPQGFSVALTYADAMEGKRVFDAFSQGGTVRMPFQKTFWAEGFGMVTDRFGTPWIVSSGPEA